MTRHLVVLGLALLAQGVAPRSLDVPARTLPVPEHVSPAMQALVGAPLSATLNVVTTSPEEWKALSAPAANPALPALRERFGVTVESTVVNGAQAYMVTPRSIPPENRNRLLVHVHGGCYVLGGGESATTEAIYMAAFG